MKLLVATNQWFPDFAGGSARVAAETARRLAACGHEVTVIAPRHPGEPEVTREAGLVKLDIPVGHIEAGLRSFDRTMPEEITRVLTDQVASWCFTHSPEAEENLLREGIERERIRFVGNTMIDTLVRLRPQIERSNIHRRLGIESGAYVLVTLHRPALVDGPLFDKTLASLARLSTNVPVVYPVHPRARDRIGTMFDAPHLKLIDAIGYVDFVALQARSRAVVTDSGGVQEETTYLRVPCLTVRETASGRSPLLKAQTPPRPRC